MKGSTETYGESAVATLDRKVEKRRNLQHERCYRTLSLFKMEKYDTFQSLVHDPQAFVDCIRLTLATANYYRSHVIVRPAVTQPCHRDSC